MNEPHVIPRKRPGLPLTITFGLAILVSACTAESAAAPLPVATTPEATTSEWCSRVQAANQLIAEVNSSETDFAHAKRAYVAFRDAVSELRATIIDVPADHRDDVGAVLAQFDEIANTVVGSADQQEADERLAPVLGRTDTDSTRRGAVWIKTTCRVPDAPPTT